MVGTDQSLGFRNSSTYLSSILGTLYLKGISPCHSPSMPRPKVLPSQRQRASEACNSCREAKKRCSGTAPCTHCLRRGIGGTCVISHRPRGSRNSQSSIAVSGDTAVPMDMTNSRNHADTESSSRSMRRPPRTPHDTRQATTARVISQTSPNQVMNGDSAVQETMFRPMSPSESRTTAEIEASTTQSADEQIRDDLQPGYANSSLLTGKPSSRMLLNLRGERGRPHLALCTLNKETANHSS